MKAPPEAFGRALGSAARVDPPSRIRPALRGRRAGGFTLVEVLVALFIMAILAGMAWQGIDGLVRTRDGANGNTEASLRLSSVMAQWELDLNQIQQSSAAPGLRYDGSALRMTRRTPEGIQIVVWTLQGNDWYRWASPPVTRTQDLQEWWLRSQQWTAMSKDALKMLEGVSSLQVYYYWNAWSNAQSTGDKVVVAPTGTPPPGGTPGNTGTGTGTEDTAGGTGTGAGTGGAGGTTGGSGGQPVTPPPAELANEDQLPGGVRLVLTLPGGVLVRDLAIHPSI